MTTPADKIAGAPISWGVCEVPGWGYQLPPDRVLTEMAQVGLAATEFGPDGFLPSDPAAMAGFLATHHLTAVGGFTPVVLHEAAHDPAPGGQGGEPVEVGEQRLPAGLIEVGPGVVTVAAGGGGQHERSRVSRVVPVEQPLDSGRRVVGGLVQDHGSEAADRSEVMGG